VSKNSVQLVSAGQLVSARTLFQTRNSTEAMLGNGDEDIATTPVRANPCAISSVEVMAQIILVTPNVRPGARLFVTASRSSLSSNQRSGLVLIMWVLCRFVELKR
jgi:hypothetical protein